MRTVGGDIPALRPRRRPANGEYAEEPPPLAPKTIISPPQEIYTVPGGFARLKMCQKMQNNDNGHGGGLPVAIHRANLDGPGGANLFTTLGDAYDLSLGLTTIAYGA